MNALDKKTIVDNKYNNNYNYINRSIIYTVCMVQLTLARIHNS